MKKILILGVAAVQYDAIKFLKQHYENVEVHAIAMKNDGPASKIADFFSEINIIDVLSIKKYIKKNNIDFVYSVGSDLSMPIVCGISEDLGMPHFISKNAAIICNNKNRMRTILGEKFKGNVAFQELSEIKDFDKSKFGEYPLFLKPSDSQGQRGIKKINTFNDLEYYFEGAKKYSRNGTVILEKFISGQEISVNGYMINGKLAFSEISDRNTWDEFEGLIRKHVLPSKYKQVLEDEVADLLYRIAIKIGILNGPIYAQMKIENNKPYIIEVTPRLDGCHMWKLINVTNGLNLLKLTLEHLMFNDVSEIKNEMSNSNRKGILEFICQEPNSKAHYPKDFFINSIESFMYYSENDLVRPVNGVFDKIGYKIVVEGE